MNSSCSETWGLDKNSCVLFKKGEQIILNKRCYPQTWVFSLWPRWLKQGYFKKPPVRTTGGQQAWCEFTMQLKAGSSRYSRSWLLPFKCQLDVHGLCDPGQVVWPGQFSACSSIKWVWGRPWQSSGWDSAFHCGGVRVWFPSQETKIPQAL